MIFSKSYIKKCKALNIDPLTQDELVELCMALPKFKKKKTYLQLFSHFRIGLQRLCCDSYLDTQNMHELWLIFYIKETQNLIWDEGTAKWIK